MGKRKFKHKRGVGNFNMGVVKLKPGWEEDIIETFRKYDMPYKQKIRDIKKAISNGEAVEI